MNLQASNCSNVPFTKRLFLKTWGKNAPTFYTVDMVTLCSSVVVKSGMTWILCQGAYFLESS